MDKVDSKWNISVPGRSHIRKQPLHSTNVREEHGLRRPTRDRGGSGGGA